jgi:nicotinamidase/pyrazinamidase
MRPIPRSKTSLLVVDAQRGFSELEPDQLPVPGGTAIVPQVNRLLEQDWARVDASQDWHPPGHSSFFNRRDNLYPPHCVLGTAGADFLPGLHTEQFHAIWRKGFRGDFPGYDLTADHPGFPALLRAGGVDAVVVCGLATNICCFQTARSLREAGFRVLLAEDASAGIDVPAAGLYQATAKAEACALGVEYVTTAEVLAALVP